MGVVLWHSLLIQAEAVCDGRFWRFTKLAVFLRNLGSVLLQVYGCGFVRMGLASVVMLSPWQRIVFCLIFSIAKKVSRW